eukprot:3600812-Lingulodinium_polyedra.AAC.1
MDAWAEWPRWNVRIEDAYKLVVHAQFLQVSKLPQTVCVYGESSAQRSPNESQQSLHQCPCVVGAWTLTQT